MVSAPLDLLAIARSAVIAPAGCGKTELLSRTLAQHGGKQPVLVLTHTNAGVAALRSRLERANVQANFYRLATIDGWAMRLIKTFPMRSGHDPAILEGRTPGYVAIRRAAAQLLASGHVSDVIQASYARLLVDEYQDCSVLQHQLVAALSALLPTVIVGDPMQAIFGFDRNDPLAGWHTAVLNHFGVAGTLADPWRWRNVGTETFGQWLLYARSELEAGRKIDLRQAVPEVRWIQLDGSQQDHQRQLAACQTRSPVADWTVLIIGDSRNPSGQQRFAAQTPGAVTVEAVDLRDLVSFAETFDLNGAAATAQILDFAQRLMTNVGTAELTRRLDVLRRGQARKEPNDVEKAALAFETERHFRCVANLLSELNRQSGARVFRPAVFRACMQALQRCDRDGTPFADTAIAMREEYRMVGRSLPRRAVGSTLLLKGLEADVAVVLGADELDARHLYVAMTRGSRQLVICSRTPILG